MEAAPVDGGSRPKSDGGDEEMRGAEEVGLPVVGPPAAPKKRPDAPPRHRIVGKTPRSLAGRVAELVSARTTETAGDLSGAALAECILQVTGPPSITRAATKARKLLKWLRTHTKRGSAKVCGRSVTQADVREAEKLVGDVWSKKLMKLQRTKTKAKKQKRLLERVATDPSLQPASVVAARKAGGRAAREGAEDGEASSEDESDVPGSDLSDEEEVDSEVEVGDAERGEGFVDFRGAAPLPAAAAGDYRGDWAGAPSLGSATFNAFAADVLRRAGIAQALPSATLDKSAPCPPLQPHQEAAVFLLHPKSPVTRLLVDHPTGSGKTREMIEVLDNYFYDARPKVPVFPKEPVCRNFYGELLRWPSKYRDYFCCLRPHSAARASSAADWRGRRAHLWDIGHLSEKELRAICREMREVLEMKGCFFMGRMRRVWRDDFTNRFPGEPLPAAPLRALRYTSAGGRHTALHEEDGLPASALFKIGFNREDPNVYSNKIVVMDEVHNLVRVQTQFCEQLRHLRELLFRAKGMVLAGFTGTPILSEPHEGRQLLDIIKGVDAPAGDAGFISSFPMRPPSLFPASLPRGVPDAALTPKLRRQFVQKVVLTGESLQRYDKKRAAGLPLRRLQRYCNLSVHFGAMHEGKSGSRARVLGDIESCAPKLHAVARDVASDRSKALVLVAKHSGMDALIRHLRKLAAEGTERFGVATMDELAAFNSKANLRGELYRVLVADSTQCGEGVSFFAVRRVMLADVPACPSTLVQAVGRSIRMYGHDGLPEEERTVTTALYVSVLPRWMRSPIGSWAYRALRFLEPQLAQSKARRLLRRLMKVGIPTLEALRDKVVEHFPKEAAAAYAAAAAAAAPTQAPVDAEMPPIDSKPAPAADTEERAVPGADILLPSLAAASDDTATTAAGSSPPPSSASAAASDASPWSGGGVMPSTPVQRLRRRDSCESDVALPAAAAATTAPGAVDALRSLRRGDSCESEAMLQALRVAAGDATQSRSLRRSLSCESQAQASLLEGAAGSAPGATTIGGVAAAKAAPKRARAHVEPKAKLPQPEVVKFLESIGLWHEAKAVGTSAGKARDQAAAAAAKLPSSPSRRVLMRRLSKESAASGSARAGASKPGIKSAPRQHWLVRALQWLLEDESLDKVVERMALATLSADEQAVRSLAEHSRIFVPALKELRREAIDREVLEGLMASLPPQQQCPAAAAAVEESEGETSAADFGVSAGSSGGEDDAPPPFVLPPDWQMERVKRGRGMVRQFVDPSGKRYKTEAEARKVVDELRRSANMSDRLRERFEGRLAAARARAAAAAAAAAPDPAAAGA